ncbi:MAG: Na(+)-translocating NADH-quinone reductase subunit A [Bacteroidales bacterium]|nr:Na(+)-translocating NADH-quinone reductase subunit A [Bacteroidales bacterium]
MEVIRIKKGIDIPLLGEVNDLTPRIYTPTLYAIQPHVIKFIQPKLLVEEGQSVKAGQPIVLHKEIEKIVLTSPVTGKIQKITRGEKRRLEKIVIEATEPVDNTVFPIQSVNQMQKEEIIEFLLTSGFWPLIRQRPYGVLANPSITPRDIFITGFDTAPLAISFDPFIQANFDHFLVGLKMLQKLTSGRVILSLHVKKNNSDIYQNLPDQIFIQWFDGPHPTGNVGVHIHHVAPLRKGEYVWTLNTQDVVALGYVFNTGKRIFYRQLALTGSELKTTGVYLFPSEGQIANLLKDNLIQDNVRVISGNVLTGTKIEKDGFLMFHDTQITVIPEGDYYEFMGWAAPGFNKYSASHTFFSWLFPKRKYRLDTNYHGGERPFILSDQYDKVFPFDIFPVYLLKAIITKNIDMMEKLGIYEVIEEDFALCEFVCASKIESQQIIRDGILMMIKELGY